MAVFVEFTALGSNAKVHVNPEFVSTVREYPTGRDGDAATQLQLRKDELVNVVGDVQTTLMRLTRAK